MHTDRGSDYCGWNHRDQISRYGLVASMSGHGMPLMEPDALRQGVFQTIEVEYNRTRRHSALGYLSPEAFEARIVG